MKQTIVILLILSSFIRAQAQFSDTTKYHLMYSSSGVLNNTQSKDSYVLQNMFNFDDREKYVRYNLSGSYVYGKQNGELTNNDFSTTLNVDLLKFAPSPKFFYWALINYNTTYSLKIVDENQLGLGLAYIIFKDSNSHINISDGIIYEQNNLIVNDLPLDYSTYRNSIRLKFHFILRQLLLLDGTTFYQNSFSNGNDYIIRSTNSAQVKLSKCIGLGTTVSYSKFNLTSRQNLLVTYGFSLNKEFK